MSFLQELKRRNVFRVGIAYLIVAWLVLQVADVVLGNIGSPEWLFKSLLLILAVGFPITLVIAWAFELTPEGLKRDSDVPREESIAPQTGARLNLLIIVVLTMAVVYFALDKFVLSAPDGAATAGQTAAGQSQVAKSIVVLPFSNRSASADDAFFVDGIHDDILTHLSKLATFEKVISRTTADSYRDTSKPISQIATELGVAAVLEGGVQRAGDNIRINMQLIDARTDKHLWAEIYERRMTVENLFAIQTEITREVVAALNGALSEQDQELLEARPTENMEAYKQYTLGRQLLGRRTAASLQQALGHFERAIELDPDYSLAYVGIADVLTLQPEYAGIDMESTFVRRREAIEKALAINPLSGEAYTAKAALAIDEEDMELAERYFLKAIELNPNYATARHWYAGLLDSSQRLDEAIVQISKARDVDPAAPVLAVNEAGMLIKQGRFREAVAVLGDTLKISPEFPGLYTVRAGVYFAQGDFANALRWVDRAVEIAPDAPGDRLFQCELLIQLQMYAEAVACTERAAAALPGDYVGTLRFARLANAVEDGSLPALVSDFEAQGDDSEEAYRSLAVARFLSGDRIGGGEALRRSNPALFDDDASAEVAEAGGLSAIAAAYFSALGNDEKADAIYAAIVERVEQAPEGLRRIRLMDGVLAAATRGDSALATQKLQEAIAENCLHFSFLLRSPVVEAAVSGSQWQSAVSEVDERIAAMRAEYEATRDAPLLL